MHTLRTPDRVSGNISRSRHIENHCLPVELEQYIFELAARSVERKSHLLNFSLVCRRSLQWCVCIFELDLSMTARLTGRHRIEPFLYKTLSLKGSDHPLLKCEFDFLDALTHQNDRGQRRSAYVRAMSVCVSVPLPNLVAAIDICPNVTKLALWHRDIPSKTLETLCQRPLQLLSTWLEILELCSPYYQSVDAPWLASLTHMHVMVLEGRWRRWRFDLLPSLTHLAMDCNPYDLPDSAYFSKILSTCEHLSALALITDSSFADVRLLIHNAFLDRRLVLIHFRRGGVIPEWLAQVDGESSIWTDIEQALKDNQSQPHVTEP